MSDVLHTAPCGCRVIRDVDGCGMHIEWCALHGAAGEMRDALVDAIRRFDYLALNGMIQGDDIAPQRAALARARGEDQQK